MSAAANPVHAAHSSVSGRRASAHASGATLLSVLRSELIKIRTVRSTWVALVSMVGVSVLGTWLSAKFLDGAAQPVDFANWTLMLFTIVLFVAMVFFAVQTAGEWSTGMARTTFGAIPSRARWVAGRALASMLSAAVLALVVIATVIGTGLIFSPGAQPWGSETYGLLWQLPLVLALMVGFATSLAIVTRSPWVAVGVLFVLQFALSIVASTLVTWLHDLLPYLPHGLAFTIAGAELSPAEQMVPTLPLAIALLVAWTVVTAVTAALVSSRRDGA